MTFWGYEETVRRYGTPAAGFVSMGEEFLPTLKGCGMKVTSAVRKHSLKKLED